MAFSVFNVLDTATVPQKFPQCRFALYIRPAPQIVAVEHQKVERAGRSLGVIHSTVQGIENGNAFGIQPDHLSVHYRGAFNESGVPDNQRVTLRPVCAIDCVEPHTTVTHMDLKPVTVMLQFMRPIRPRRWLLGDTRLAGMDESSGRI